MDICDAQMYDMGDIAAPREGKPSENHFFYNGVWHVGMVLNCSDIRNVPQVRHQGAREGPNERYFTGLLRGRFQKHHPMSFDDEKYVDLREALNIHEPGAQRQLGHQERSEGYAE